MRALILAAIAGCGAKSTPATTSSTYQNPVIDDDFADPSVLRASDGTYWVYATQVASGDRRINLQVTHTRDLVHYEPVADALPTKPTWASKTQDFWAPHPVQRGKDVLLYYAANPDTKAGMCIGVARASSPAGPFVDSGAPLVCGEGFTTIDAFVLDDPKTKKSYLFWGSNSAPIVARELAADGVSFAPGSEVKPVFEPDRKAPYENLIEGPWIVIKDGHYVLFYSGDNCCGKNAHYAVLVARADDALGPYTRRDAAHGGPVLVEKNDHWIGPGHNAVATDASGQDWLLYHALDPKRPSEPCPTTASGVPEEGVLACGKNGELPSRRPLLVDRITWRDGWPYVEGPTSTPQPAPKAAR